MKHTTIFILCLLIKLSSFGQVDVAVNKLIDARLSQVGTGNVDIKIDSFSKTMDSLVIKTPTRSGSFVIDTLSVPVNTSGIFTISILGTSGTMVASGIKNVVVANRNGTYVLIRNNNQLSFSGITGATWECLIINNRVVIRINGVNTTNWQLKRFSL